MSDVVVGCLLVSCCLMLLWLVFWCLLLSDVVVGVCLCLFLSCHVSSIVVFEVFLLSVVVIVFLVFLLSVVVVVFLVLLLSVVVLCFWSCCCL